MSGEEDWERAEAALNSLSLNGDPAAPEQLEEDRADEPIDSALMSAMENPRERMAVFQIEDILLKFVKSNERMMEIPPGLNSFKRLLAHRIGQRFGLNRTVSDTCNESGERGIILYKTAATCVPKLLLIDFAKTVAAPADAPAASTSAKEGSKKIMVMKRSAAANSSGSGKFSSAKAQVTSEDREKAYNEARARIFGEEAVAAAAGGSTSPGPEEAAVTKSPVAVGSARGGAGQPQPQPQPQLHPVEVPRLGRSSSGSNLAQEPVISPPSRAIAGEEDRRGGGRRVVDAGSWKERKSQLRDLEAEKSDPDFVRRANPPPPAPMSMSTAMPMSAPMPLHMSSPYDGMYGQYRVDARSPIPMAPPLTAPYYYPEVYSMATLDPRYAQQAQPSQPQLVYYYSAAPPAQAPAPTRGPPSHKDFPPLS